MRIKLLMTMLLLTGLASAAFLWLDDSRAISGGPTATSTGTEMVPPLLGSLSVQVTPRLVIKIPVDMNIMAKVSQVIQNSKP